jgi:hypothetical protein
MANVGDVLLSPLLVPPSVQTAARAHVLGEAYRGDAEGNCRAISSRVVGADRQLNIRAVPVHCTVCIWSNGYVEGT